MGGWQEEEEEGVLPYRPSHTNVPQPQNKGALSGAGLTLGMLTAGTPDDIKGGALLGRLCNSLLLLF